jgi:hypothetical protein
MNFAFHFQILKNVDASLMEDGSPISITDADRAESIKLWTSREIRVLYSITNCAIFQKVHTSTDKNYMMNLQFYFSLLNWLLTSWSS